MSPLPHISQKMSYGLLSSSSSTSMRTDLLEPGTCVNDSLADGIGVADSLLGGDDTG